MNKSKLKLTIIAIIIATLLTIFGMFQYKALATATNEMASVGAGDPPEFPYITYNDLVELYQILCCQKGTALPSYSKTIVTQGDESSSEPYLTMNDIGKRLFEKTQSASGYTTNDNFTNPYTSTESLTYGYYTKSDAIVTSPAESYILAEMTENTYGTASDFYNITNKVYTGEVTSDVTITIFGKTLYGIDLSENSDGYTTAENYVIESEDGKYYYVEITAESDYFPYTYIQYAWWTTDAGGSTVVKSTALQKEAEAFEAYINKVAKKDSSGNIVTESKTVTVNGQTVTVTAPVIDFKTSKDTSRAAAYYDENYDKYLIGPFSITYYEESVTSSRGTVIFSEIVNATLKSNLGTVPSKKWKFVFPDRAVSDTAVYPHTGENFYIVVDYIEGMTEIKDLHFSFKYMNAGGEYASLTGEFFKATWEGKSEAVWCEEESSYCECGGTSSGPHRAQYDSDGNFIGYACDGGAIRCSHGYYHTHIIGWNYWLELTDLDPQDSQTLAEGLVAARWYEDASISLYSKIPTLTEINGKKTWNDNGKDRPESVTLELYANGKSTGKYVTITADDNWEYTFDKLSRYDEDGNKVIYTVVEVGLEGYTTTYSGSKIINTPDEDSGDDDDDDDDEPEAVNISGTKTWDDNDNADETRPTSVKVTLYRNGKATSKTYTMTASNGWKYSFTNLPKYDSNGDEYAYTVVEEAVAGYDSSYDGYDIINTQDEPGIKLTIPIEGEVWIDTDPDKKNDTTYGYKDDEDTPYEKAEVYVYKVYLRNGTEIKRELARIYADDNKTELSFPIYTDSNGKYTIPAILVPGTEDENYSDCDIAYDVVFMYDGQTYEASDFLPTADGNASTYINASRTDKANYEKDSMAIEDGSERNSFNKKFTQIYGKTAIDDNGNTTGESSGDGNTYTLDYTSTEYQLSSSESRRISILTTTDSDGYILDQYKMSASTGNAGILYPVNERISIENADDVKEISVNVDNGIKTVTYKTIYNYMLHINLAVKERDDADLAVGKDLYKAELVVNEKSLTYKYNTLYDFEDEANKDLLDIQLEAAKAKTYTLGLYSSDYAYRSKVYSTAADVVKNIKQDTELRAFLTYKVVVFNESESYDAIVNELTDYYDAAFTLVDEDIAVNVLDNDGVRSEQTVAESTYYRVITAGNAPKYYYNSTEDVSGLTSGSATWKQNSSFSASSDYKEMTTSSLSGLKLAAGDRVEIFVTFEVDSAGFLDKDSTDRPELLGEKNNIAEISNYSTYNTDGSIAGKIDKDSAPDNLDFGKNVKSWYEDDTESAPVINIYLYNYSREINGVVWEDKETNTLKYNQNVGDGIYDTSNENGISNLDVQLIEKISIDDVEYEYLWPADAFDGTVAADGYNSTDVTVNGNYALKGFVAGNYVVRFKYGNREDSITYNGQDYKNTAYQADMTNSDGTTTLNNEWHDLTDETLKAARVSDARDYELQRMKVVAYSRTISNQVGTVLETADDTSVSHTELIENTQMVANTAKLNLELERQDYIDYGTEKLVDGVTEYTYVVENIDFGLEKRSETSIELTKDLKSITLYKNSGTAQIMKVTINDDGTVDYEASEEISKLLRVEKTETAQGFSYIIMEESYLKDLTIKLEYNITVKNTSEVDWTGLLAEFDDTQTAAQGILAEVEMLEEADDYVSGKGIVYGDYVGLNYYNNKNNSSDVIVTTKVENIIDYVDINTSIDNSSVNLELNNAWANISTSELQENNLLADSVYTIEADGTKVIADENDRVYDGSNVANIYVNVSEIYNPDLVTELVPMDAAETGIATSGSISIVTSKTSTSEESAADLIFDNLSEIIKYSNTVGRRDPQAVPGNAQIARGEFTATTGYADGQILTDYVGAKDVEVSEVLYSLNGERDTDAAEFVTFTDPTGKDGQTSKLNSNMIYLLLIAIACMIVSVGIVTIKIKVINVPVSSKKNI